MKNYVLLIIAFCLASCNVENDLLEVKGKEPISRAWGGYRNLTEAEEEAFLSVFPNLNVHDVGVIDEHSGPAYNCIGWAMDVRKWIDPAIDMKDFQAQFESAHIYYGSSLRFTKTDKLSAASIVDGWGFVGGEMTHASRLYRGSWTSKLGELYCITHNRGGLTSKVYGAIQMSFKNYYSRTLVADTTTVIISPNEIETVRLKAQKVDQATRFKFNQLHESWYKAVEDDINIRLNNSMYARCELPEFKELVEMGEEIVPLLMEKLLDEKYFFSQVVYEAIQKDAEAIPYKTYYDGSHVLQSSQDRAKRIVKIWSNKL